MQWEIYNSKDYNVPQNRERVFFKGYLRTRCGSEILPQPTSCGSTDGKLIRINKGRPRNQSDRIYDSNGLSVALNAQANNGLYRINKIGNFSPSGHRGRDVFSTDGIAPTLCSSSLYKNGLNVLDQNQSVYRRLTPVECERLQGFPDGWTATGKDGEQISDTQRYKCLGNAVTTNVITAIANEMFPGVTE